jgi:hypothetical protein
MTDPAATSMEESTPTEISLNHSDKNTSNIYYTRDRIRNQGDSGAEERKFCSTKRVQIVRRKKMDHVRRESLSAFLDGELVAEERDGIVEHLKGCRQCRGEMEDLARVSKLISSVQDVEASPYFVSRLKRRISEERSTRSLLLRLVEWMRGVGAVPLAVRAGATLLLVISVLVGSHLGSTIHRQQLKSAAQSGAQLEESLNLASFDDFPDGSLGDVYGSLYVEGGKR